MKQFLKDVTSSDKCNPHTCKSVVETKRQTSQKYSGLPTLSVIICRIRSFRTPIFTNEWRVPPLQMYLVIFITLRWIMKMYFYDWGLRLSFYFTFYCAQLLFLVVSACRNFLTLIVWLLAFKANMRGKEKQKKMK